MYVNVLSRIFPSSVAWWPWQVMHIPISENESGYC